MTDAATTASHIEAILFSEGGPVGISKLARSLKMDEALVRDGLRVLRERLSGTGLTLVESETEAVLAVSDASRLAVEEAYQREASREIGDAGLETLAILLYHGASTRAQIDYIRGVGTSSTIRSLLGRGLVERVSNPGDSREYLYRPTAELLAHLGAEQMEDLPDYAKIASELTAFESAQQSPNDHGTGEPAAQV